MHSRSGLCLRLPSCCPRPVWREGHVVGREVFLPPCGLHLSHRESVCARVCVHKTARASSRRESVLTRHVKLASGPSLYLPRDLSPGPSPSPHCPLSLDQQPGVRLVSPQQSSTSTGSSLRCPEALSVQSSCPVCRPHQQCPVMAWGSGVQVMCSELCSRSPSQEGEHWGRFQREWREPRAQGHTQCSCSSTSECRDAPCSCRLVTALPAAPSPGLLPVGSGAVQSKADGAGVSREQ